jgi:hypothetical protein
LPGTPKAVIAIVKKTFRLQKVFLLQLLIQPSLLFGTYLRQAVYFFIVLDHARLGRLSIGTLVSISITHAI